MVNVGGDVFGVNNDGEFENIEIAAVDLNDDMGLNGSDNDEVVENIHEN